MIESKQCDDCGTTHDVMSYSIEPDNGVGWKNQNFKIDGHCCPSCYEKLHRNAIERLAADEKR